MALRCKSMSLYFLLVIVVSVVMTLVESGVVSNESQSVSVSSSITKSKSFDEPKKPSTRGGKVLYTAPYSHVRVSKNEGKQATLLPGTPSKFRSLMGPVLIKKAEEKPTTTTTTTTTTTATPIVLIDVVTEPDSEETESDSTIATTTTVNV